MSCKELVELVTDYLEGALSPGDVADFEKHLSFCPGCRDYLTQMRQTVQTLGKLTEDSIPEDAKQELLAIFHDWKSR
jgi:predicted anti-sigma-YlaC factor YlaD